MTTRARLAAAVAAAALAACTSSSTTSPGALLAEPSSVAVFRGVTLKTAGPESTLTGSQYHPYLAVANAASHGLSILDAVDDTIVTSPALTRGLAYPVPGRPILLAAGDLGDGKPDLLVVVTAGDLPWLGGTQLRVIRTWLPDGALVDRTDGQPAVELAGDVVALRALPFDPAAPGSVTLVAALAGERIATVSFTRAAAGDAIDVDAAQATVRTSAALGFQPLELASIPGERARVFAATTDPIPGGVQGVAELDVSGTPVLAGALNAHAPTRLVAAGRLAEALPFALARDASDFAGQAPVDRVYAVLDESSCGLYGATACGLVALDPVTRDLLPDPAPAGSMHAPYRAPIPVGYALALGFSGPPAVAPSDAEPQYAGTFERVATGTTTWATTGVLAVASAEGYVTFVDAARWTTPSSQPVFANVKATVTSTRPAGVAGTQWLTLVDPWNGATVAHADATGLTTSVEVTGGYTPSDRWTVTRQGALPGLTARRAEAFGDGSIALQVTSAGAVQEVVRVWDPTLGVRAGDVVVLDASGLGTCTTFEAEVAEVRAPAADRPGGSLALTHRTPTVAAWDRCVDLLAAASNVGSGSPWLVATVRAGDYVLVRGTGTGAVHVGRPAPGQRFEVAWQDETALTTGADACTLPPAVAWPGGGAACGAGCRASCEALVRARLARRLGYVEGLPAGLAGPAIAFTLALEQPAAAAPRDLALVVNTSDGAAPFRVTTTANFPVDPRQVLPFDRTPWAREQGIRFLVPWAGGAVLDATPSVAGGGAATIR